MMSGQVVVDMVLEAYSLEECLVAEEAPTRWLASHPGDLGLSEIAGQLGIVKEAALEREGIAHVFDRARYAEPEPLAVK